jgi:hypothetical protein
MGGPPDPREARSEDPPIQGQPIPCLRLWMARIRWRYAPEAGHSEDEEVVPREYCSCPRILQANRSSMD